VFACAVFQNLVMARKGPKVLLGFEDECITDKHKSLVSFTTNKIGGRPVSMFFSLSLEVVNNSKCRRFRCGKVIHNIAENSGAL
jgi:hypothetical protein